MTRVQLKAERRLCRKLALRTGRTLSKDGEFLKREYTSPGMLRVQLKAEEAVLTACKSWGNGGTGAYTPGFGGGNCDQMINPTQHRCSIIGS